jgi:predicted nucleotidyltransferase
MFLRSKLKVSVLRTLWKHMEKEFTIRELAGFLGISHTGVRRVLREFERMNVLTIRTFGRFHVFKLNTKSYGFSVIERLFELEENTLLKLKRMLNKEFSVPEVIFGSIVQGKETSFNDIDLLIVTQEKEKIEGIVAGLQKLQRDLGIQSQHIMSVEKTCEINEKNPQLNKLCRITC